MTVLLIACRADTAMPVEILDAQAPAPLSETDAMAVYLVIANHQAVADTLRDARVDGAAAFSVHRTVTRGMTMQMEPVPVVVIPARGEYRLEPGGIHGMVMGLTRAFIPGDTLRLTLEFARAGPVPVAVPVRSYDQITG